MIELYLFYKYLALRQFREAGPKYPISCAGKVIQSLQLQISHQMRPYSNVKAIRGSSSYTCLRVFGSLGQFWQTGPKYPKIIRVKLYLFNDIWALGQFEKLETHKK